MASLFVYMNGYEVGEYIQHSSGAQEFIYSDDWLEKGVAAIPLSLSLPLTSKKHVGDRVYNYFDNLLPDSQNIRDRIQARFSLSSGRAFDLLSAIGRDCIGAVQLLSEKANADVRKIEALPITDSMIAEELKNYRAMPLGMKLEDDFRISIAGAQEKTALLFHDGKWHRPLGVTPTTHIFKLPIGKIDFSGIDLSDSVENEWLCMEILREFKIPVPKVDIAVFEDVKALIVKRFDRVLAGDGSWIIRIPQEDMCQAHSISPASKYEKEGGPGISQIMELLRSSVHAEEDRKSFMRTVFLFWVLGAVDGHGKNFSIFLKQGGRFNLTPFYDVISAYPLVSKRQLELKKMNMAMGLHGKNTHYRWDFMLKRHWFEEAKKVYFPEAEMEKIIDGVIADLDGVIEKVAARIPSSFPEEISQSVFDGMKKALGRIVK